MATRAPGVTTDPRGLTFATRLARKRKTEVMATKKKKAKGTELIFVGATKRISVGFFVPNNVNPQYFTFWDGKINRVPADIWGAMLAKKSSPHELTGEEVPGPVEQYLGAGILWTMTAEQAQMIHEGKRPMMSPAGPDAGKSTYTPPEPRRGELTPEQKALEASLGAADTQLDRIDMGEIDNSQVKPPPAPVVA